MPSGEIDQLVHAISGKHHCIALASVDSESGTAYIAMSLAERLLGLGHRCLLIELDTDEPKVARLTGVHPEPWQADVDALFKSACAKLPNKLAVLAPGTPPLPVCRTGAWLKQLFNYAREQYDYVVVIAPPILSDAITAPKTSTIVDLMDSSVIITVARRDTQAGLVRAMAALGQGRANPSIAGVVINDITNPKLSESLTDALAPLLRNYPLLFRRIREQLSKISILNIEY